MHKRWIARDTPWPTVVRLSLYTTVVFAFTASLPLFVQHQDITVYRENGPVEWLQFSLLAAATLVLVAGASRMPGLRIVLLVLACFSAFAATRELDAILDAVLPGIGWKIAFAYLAVAAALVLGDRDGLMAQLRWFVSGRGFALLWAGFVIAVPFAQLVGHGAFLQLLMGEDYIRYYKTVIEESGELFGYFLIFAGSLETLVQAGAQHESAAGRQTRSTIAGVTT